MTAPIGLVSVDEVIARHGEILDRIASRGVAPETIEIVAVTKSFPSELIAVAVAAGFRQLGENYPQELAAKAASIELAAKVAGSKESTVQWHAIGQLQRNKVKLIAPYVALWQTIDRQSLVATVAQHAPGASVLVQINVTAGDAPNRFAQIKPDRESHRRIDRNQSAAVVSRKTAGTVERMAGQLGRGGQWDIGQIVRASDVDAG